MISSLRSHNSVNVTHKKSIPKNIESTSNYYNFKVVFKLIQGGGLIRTNTSKPKITSSKHLNEITQHRKDKTGINFHTKNNQESLTKEIKSRSCQNSHEKIVNKNALKTVYTGSSTHRNPNSTIIKRTKKDLEKYDFEFLGTETKTSKEKSNHSINRLDLFYDAHHTEKLTEVRWQSKELSINKNKKASIFSEREKSHENKRLNINEAKWDETSVPYKWKEVLEKYPHLLTKYELEEVKEYKNIYYLGHKVSKKDKERKREFTSFDNSEYFFFLLRNEYVYETHDHIAYRYEILQKMGKGSYGEVIKVFDHKKKELLALKIVRNKTKFNQQAFIEIQILTHIKEKDLEQSSNIVKIKDFIIFRKHVCIVFELLSENLYELIIRNNYNGLDSDLIRRFAIQMLTALQFLKTESIIHCDLKPENILLKEYNKSGIKIIDFGSSCFKNETKYTYIQSRYYRAPEITLGVKYNHEIDMWSVGCILAELFTGIPLFPGENEKEQMKYFIKTLGNPSLEVALNGERADLFFDKQGKPLQEVFNAKSIDHFELPLEARIKEPYFCDFIEGFLKWHPKERFTPVQALHHKWIKEGLPPEVTKVFPSEKTEKRENRSQSQKSRLKSQEKYKPNEQSPEREGYDPSNIRIKKSSKQLRQKSKELKNVKD